MFFCYSEGSSGSGGSSGVPKPFDDKNLIGFLIGASLVVFYVLYQNSYEEITWRQFLSNHLFQDNVDRLEVVNKKWVRVINKNQQGVCLIPG